MNQKKSVTDLLLNPTLKLDNEKKKIVQKLIQNRDNFATAESCSIELSGKVRLFPATARAYI